MKHPIAAVILGMGLGKTSITLTAIEQLMYDSFEIAKLKIFRSLMLAPTTGALVHNAEFQAAYIPEFLI